MAITATESEKLNAITLMKSELEREVKTIIINELVTDQLKELEDKIRPKIKELVDRVSFKAIDTFQDTLNLRNEVRIKIEINDETSNQWAFQHCSDHT